MMSAVLEALAPYLTQDEINVICHPLTQPAAQIRFMTQTLGLTVERKPGGQPLVWRSHVEAIKGPAMAGKTKLPVTPGTGPSAANLISFLGAKKRKHHGA